MDKYKMVAAINFILGIFQVGIILALLIFVAPRVFEFYADISALGPNLTLIHITSAFVLMIGFLNLYIGLKLLKSNDR